MTRKKVQNRGRTVKRRKRVDLSSLLAKSSTSNWQLVGNATGHKA
ncbi:MAG: hypothetical protein QTN59_14235 [Candidatus Electrothrix communis]|nr:MAG: hypothetical protein QTN59_14235 [Candidatus Electrothrix communis]